MTDDSALMDVLAARSLLSIRLEEIENQAEILASSIDEENYGGSYEILEDKRQELLTKIFKLRQAVKFIDRFLKED